MEQLKAHHSPAETLDALEIANAGLARDPATRPLAAEAEAHADAVEGAIKGVRKARAQRVVATAGVADADVTLDADWMTLSRFGRALAKGDPNHPILKTLYPNQTPSESVKPQGGPQQAREVARVIHLLRTDDTLVALRAHADELEQDQQALDTEVAGREALYQAEHQALAVLARVVEAAQAFYNSLEGKLLGIYRDNKRKVRRALGG